MGSTRYIDLVQQGRCRIGIEHREMFGQAVRDTSGTAERSQENQKRYVCPI